MSVSKDKKEFTFVWKIENFSMLPHQNGESLRSPVFVVDMWEGIKWSLVVYPRGDSQECVDYISCFLSATHTEMEEFELNFSLTIESNDPINEITVNMVYPVHKLSKSVGWGSRSFSSLTDIYSRKELYLQQDILSFRCHLRPMDSYYKELTVNNEIDSAANFVKKVFFSRTGIQVQQMSFTWPIQNISTRKERVETSLMVKDSPGLKVTLNFSEIANNMCVPIEIQQTTLGPLEKQEQLFVKCKITVVCADKFYKNYKESTHLFKLALNDVWHFPLFIKTTNLTHGKYLVENDTLFLQCELTFSYKSGVYHWDEKPFAFGSRKKDETSDWCTSVHSICASGKFSDVELKAGGETFPAHKLLLSARSSVFSAMFENDMKEKISGVVEIDDVDPSTLKRMLTFINSAQVKDNDLSPEDVCKLYEAADKYNVVSLKGWCTKSLISSLSIESVCNILGLADAHLDNILMTSARNFICCHETETFDSPEWESFMDSNVKLSAKVMHQVLVKRKPI